MVEVARLYRDNFSAFSERFDRLCRGYLETFGRNPVNFFSSPGRAELIGNFTESHCGKALVSTVSCDMIAAAEARDDGFVVISGENFSFVRFSIYDTAMREREKGKPIALVRGVLQYLIENGYRFGGFNAYLQSDLFRGAGRSAALEILIAEIVNRLYLNGRLSVAEKARAGLFAEIRYGGKPCAVLDQYAIASDGLNQIDFSRREPSVTNIPSIPLLCGFRMVIVNACGERKTPTIEVLREMNDVAAYFGKSVLAELNRDELLAELPALRRAVSDRALLRSLYFFDECERVARASDALLEKDIAAFLEQIRLSGESGLKYLQDCACGEDWQPVTLALNLSERILKQGACRAMGGDFAGSVLAVCSEEEAENYTGEMARVFGAEFVRCLNFRNFGVTELNGI